MSEVKIRGLDTGLDGICIGDRLTVEVLSQGRLLHIEGFVELYRGHCVLTSTDTGQRYDLRKLVDAYKNSKALGGFAYKTLICNHTENETCRQQAARIVTNYETCTGCTVESCIQSDDCSCQ